MRHMPKRANTSLFPWRVAQNCQLPILLITLGLFVIVVLLCTRNTSEESRITESKHAHVSEIVGFSGTLNPTIEIVNGTEIIWEIPTDPKAVLFIAHGCGGTPRNFWVKSFKCPKCVGLPEESQIVIDALSERYAVLVVSSTEPCWTYGKERLRVGGIINWWVEKNNLVKIPLLGLGASSGGYFLSILATKVTFRGIVLMIASGLYERMDKIPHGYPSTLFVHMPKDFRRARKVLTHIEILRKAGVEVGEIKCMQIRLTPNWLSERIPSLDHNISLKLFQSFHDKGFIDANGYMKNDGRLTPWKEALEENKIVFPIGSHLKQYIQEELNLAYAFHEMTSLQSKEIFEWLNSQIIRK